jgi:hypothetical protein
LPELSKSEILREFHELVNAGSIDNIRIQYRVSGGPPGKHITQEIDLAGGDAPVELNILHKTDNDRHPELVSEKKQLSRIDATKKRTLFKQIALGTLSGISISEKPLFLPDSVIASLIIHVKNKEPTTVRFLAYERDRIRQGKPIPPEIADAVKSLERIIQTQGREI